MKGWVKARVLHIGEGLLRNLGVEADDEVCIEVDEDRARIIRKPKGTDAWTELWRGPAEDIKPRVPFFPGADPGTVEVRSSLLTDDFKFPSDDAFNDRWQ